MKKFFLVTAAIYLPFGSLAAQAEPNTTVPESGSKWWMLLLSAIIGASSALVTDSYKEIFAKRLYDKRAKTDNQHDVFRNYAAPLIYSCEKLIWRFDEIFIQKRHHFLKSATLPLVFNEYKRRSTLYRIGSLLGWMRAINLELNALPRGASGSLMPISNNFAKVQSALADGPHVEMTRLEQICGVWHLDLKAMDINKKKTLATNFEMQLYCLAGDTLKHDSNHLKNLSDEKKLDICVKLSNYLCKELGRVAIDSKIIEESIHGAISSLSYREALIYRDWQDAIGDALLEKDNESIRKYKIIGYEKIENLLSVNSLWIEVFRESIVDIDFESIDPNDFRAKQLKDLAVAVSDILISLSETAEKDIINTEALERARMIVQERGRTTS